jgi:hypothetical protein
MALTDGDKAECKEIAREIVQEVLKDHIRTCPHHAAFEITKAKVIGIMIGVIFASGITSSAMAAIIMKIFPAIP